MIRYKLTNEHMETHGGCRWMGGEWKEASGEGSLCGPGWLHCYADPILAEFMNPIHANIKRPRLWECEVDGDCATDLGRKEGWSQMRLVQELPLRHPTMEQHVKFGILCVLDVCNDAAWRTWAANWLSGSDRSAAAAFAAYATFSAAAFAAFAAYAAFSAATFSADAAAAYAAYAAAYAADAAAAYAAYAAADAAFAAFAADLISAAHEAML